MKIYIYTHTYSWKHESVCSSFKFLNCKAITVLFAENFSFSWVFGRGGKGPWKIFTQNKTKKTNKPLEKVIRVSEFKRHVFQGKCNTRDYCKMQGMLANPAAVQTDVFNCMIHAQAVSACFFSWQQTSSWNRRIQKRDFCSGYILFKVCQKCQYYNSKGKQYIALNRTSQHQGRERVAWDVLKEAI